MRSRHRPDRPFVAGLAFAFFLSTLAPYFPSEARADDDGPKDAAIASLQKAQEELATVSRALAAMRATLDPKEFDLDAVTASLESDPAKCIAFVRDRIKLEPYRGLLRGARGTLIAGAGNSLDRAMLLAKLLLGKGGPTVRIVHGALAKEDAEALLGEALHRLASPMQGSGLDAGRVEKFATGCGLDAAATVAKWKEQEAQRANMAKELEDRSTQDTAAILEALDKAGVKLGDEAMASHDELVALLSDHFWVQVKEGEKWIDLDPSFTDAAPGKARGKGKTQFPIDQVPSALAHSVHMKLVLERVVGGKAEEVTLLARLLPSAECMGERCLFAILPSESNTQANLEQGMKGPDQGMKALDAMKVFQPSLVVGDEESSGRPFDLDGQVYEVTPKGALGAGDIVGARVSGLLEHGLGGERGAEKKSLLASLRLEWTISGPGRPERIYRRVLVDRIPPEARAAGTWDLPASSEADFRSLRVRLLRESSFSITPGRMSDAIAESITCHALQRLVDFASAIVQEGLGGPKVDLSAQFGQGCHGLPAPLLRYELARVQRMERVAAAAGCVAFYGSPSVVCWGMDARCDASGQPSTIRHSLDIVENPVRYASVSSSPGPEAPRPCVLALRQGVDDTGIERLLLEDPGHAMNASNVFRVARESGVETVALAPGQEEGLKSLECSAAARERLGADLRAGYAVVVPTRPVTVGGERAVAWWRVDPHTGASLGILEDGSGGDAAETLTVTAVLKGLVLGVALGFVCIFLAAISGTNPPTWRYGIVCMLLGVGVGLAPLKGLATLGGIIAGILAGGIWMGSGGPLDKPMW